MIFGGLEHGEKHKYGARQPAEETGTIPDKGIDGERAFKKNRREHHFGREAVENGLVFKELESAHLKDLGFLQEFYDCKFERKLRYVRATYCGIRIKYFNERLGIDGCPRASGVSFKELYLVTGELSAKFVFHFRRKPEQKNCPHRFKDEFEEQFEVKILFRRRPDDSEHRFKLPSASAAMKSSTSADEGAQ